MANLVEVTLPEGIKFIPQQALERSALSSIVIPQGCDSIGYGAFSLCSFLSNIEIPNSVRYINEHAFVGCPLKSFTFPENYEGAALIFNEPVTMDIVWNTISLSSYGTGGLLNYYYSRGAYNTGSKTIINSIVFGEKVEVIPAYLCFCLPNITEVTIPNSVKKIGSHAFQRCALTKITMGEGVEEIGDYAFSRCGLSEITISENVNSIGSYAFEECSNMKRMYCKAQQPPILGSNAIPSSVNVIYVPRQSVDEYRMIWSDYASKILGYDFE